MKVLFVSSGNSNDFEIVPFVKAQGETLRAIGVDVHYYPIVGKGILGYMKAYKGLREHIKKENYDIIHAHFTLSGWLCVLAGRNVPIVLSLMGTDAQGVYKGEKDIEFKSRGYMALTYLIQPFVDRIISKSKNIENHVYLKAKSRIIPNGVDLHVFKPSLRRNTGLRKTKKTILFLGNKNKIGKNFLLAEEAVLSLNRNDVELSSPFPVPHHEIPQLLNEADVLVVPSFMEGSPNSIKEAMACNCPIVATNVGDIGWVMGDTRGCYVASFEVDDFADKIEKALEFSSSIGRTKGYERIKALGLDSATVSRQIRQLYEDLLLS